MIWHVRRVFSLEYGRDGECDLHCSQSQSHALASCHPSFHTLNGPNSQLMITLLSRALRFSTKNASLKYRWKIYHIYHRIYASLLVLQTWCREVSWMASQWWIDATKEMNFIFTSLVFHSLVPILHHGSYMWVISVCFFYPLLALKYFMLDWPCGHYMCSVIAHYNKRHLLCSRIL